MEINSSISTIEDKEVVETLPQVAENSENSENNENSDYSIQKETVNVEQDTLDKLNHSGVLSISTKIALNNDDQDNAETPTQANPGDSFNYENYENSENKQNSLNRRPSASDPSMKKQSVVNDDPLISPKIIELRRSESIKSTSSSNTHDSSQSPSV